MASTFQSLKKNCPICFGARRDCRENTHNHLIHCRHEVGEVPGYRYVGEDKQGFFMWAVNESNTRSLEELERLKREREALKQRRLQQEQDRVSQLLSESERDPQIRKILAQLRLNQAHREDLRRRGLTDKQSEAGQFRSVEPWQKLEQEVSHQLAGVNITGHGLTNFHSGYICPIRNPQGLLIGWQQRLNTTEKADKYRWSTSISKKRPNGPTAHLRNGELPITCCRPVDGKPLIPEIGLIEGVGPKPFITAQLRSQIVLGAAGGNFAASRQTLEAYLDTLSAELGTKQLTLYPDAGAISNSHVMRQYQRLQELVTRWGYKLRVAWWEQIHKTADLDADELLAAGRGEEIEEITWAEFEAKSRNPKWLYQEVIQLFQKARIGKKRRPIKVGTPPQSTPSLKLRENLTEVNYVPGFLPTPDEYKAMGAPKFVFKAGARIRFYQEARFKGFQYQLDTSHPGSGKSHDIGLMTPAAFFLQDKEVDDTSSPQEKLIYFSQSSRNPTVSTLEQNFTPLPVRHNGLISNPMRTTPMGNSFVHWPQPGENADITANCHLSHLHIALAERNLGISGSFSRGKSDINPVCRQCKFLANREETGCQNDIGNGYGFKHEIKTTIVADRLRATFQGFPELSLSNAGVIVDEAMANLSPTTDITAELSDLSYTFIILKLKHPELYERLAFVREALESRLSGVIVSPAFGWDLKRVKEWLGDVPSDIDELITTLQLFTTEQGLADLRLLRSNNSSQWVKEHCIKNWLVPFLQVWSGLIPGSLQVTKGKVTIMLRNDRQLGIVKGAAFAIFQDATAVRDRLAQYLEVCKSEIILCEQRQPNYENLTIVQVTGLGLVGKDRSQLCDQRLKALKAKLAENHPNIGFIDWKAKAAAGELAHFSGGRGSNEYATKNAIASFGVPYQNLSALQNIYQTVTGQIVAIDLNGKTDEHFQRFIDERTQSEIFQEIGRLRAGRRQGEQLTFYFCSDYPLDFLKQYGIKVTTVTAAEITPAAGDATTRGRWFATKVFEAAYAVGRNLAKLTQAEIAKELGITQGRLSQLFTSVEGGWRGFKKLLISLIEKHKEKLIFSEGDGKAFLEDWILESPQATLGGVKDLLEVVQLPGVGWKGLEDILSTSTTDITIGILGQLLSFLPNIGITDNSGGSCRF